jgi:hypothetical protein
MSENNDSRLEARECLRKANRSEGSQNRWAWLVLAKAWLLLARSEEIDRTVSKDHCENQLNSFGDPH